MSTRQRSFFDQNHATRGGAVWHRRRIPTDTPHDRNLSVMSESARPPLPISSQTKSKLKAFEFSLSDGHPRDITPTERIADASSEKNLNQKYQTPEAQRAAEGLGKENQKEELHETMLAAPLPSSVSKSSIKPANKSPRTPALSRMPLAELISNVENPLWQPTQEPSPDDRVYWKHRRSPTSSDARSSFCTPAPILRRRKKRARSSSPIPSPCEATLDKADNKEADTEAMHKAVKTPQVDPALELWKRFSVNSLSKPVFQPAQLPALTQIMALSPRTKVNGLGPGLRRSQSCGTEWPTSGTKRRKVTKGSPFGRIVEDVIKEGHTLPDAQPQSKLSRVSLLVEKIQESLTKPHMVEEESGPSSSSPLPERSTSFNPASLSPLQEKTKLPEGSLQADLPEPAMEYSECNTPQKSNASSSDFGDLDMEQVDLSVFEGTSSAFMKDRNCSFYSTAVSQIAEGSRPEDKPFGASQEQIAAFPVALQEQKRGESFQSKASSSDTFDDGEDGLFAADLEEVMAKYELQMGSTASKPLKEPIEYPPASLEQFSSFTEHAVGSQRGTTQMQPLQVATNGEEFSDEFGDLCDNDFELAAAEILSKNQVAGGSESRSNVCRSFYDHQKSLTKTTKSSASRRAIQRYLICKVAEGQYKTNQGYHGPEKVLLVREERTQLSKAITLRQSWCDSRCSIGDYVHVIGDFTPDGQCVIDDAHNMLILHPDHLISATVIADSFGCMRRAVLQDRVKATTEASAPQVYGHILHEVFQEALKTNIWDTDWLRNVVVDVVKRHLEGIYQINIPIPKVLDLMNGKISELQAWANTFVNHEPKPDAVVSDRNGKATISINKLLDVEEHVWSPMYGMKGNIDATVQIAMKDDEGQRTLVVPLELKTGKNTSNTSHRAQTALYTLLLADRYDIDVACGILYYMETSAVSRVQAIRTEMRQMVIQRNELACYLRDRLQLPPMLKRPHTCNMCYAKVPCHIYHKLVDDGNGETSGLHDKFEKVVGHLKPQHQVFFRYWDDLLTKEETSMMKHRRELWTMLSHEREQLGRCFGNVVIEPGSAHEDADAPRINRYQYSLIKKQPKPGFSFLDSQLSVGEPIVISDEKGHFALANGYVKVVGKRRITVAVDRRLHNARIRRPGFHPDTNQSFTGIMEVTKDGASSSPMHHMPEEPVVYRLDKDEFSNGLATVRNNLIETMTEGQFGSREIRSLVVDGTPPRFKTCPTAYSIPKEPGQSSLNADQKRAIEKVMSAEDYVLVLGMPGTGKTSTIAHIIRALVSQGKSVLLTSYTHTAVDNILLKIRDSGIGILRLGALAKIHPEIQQFAVLAGVGKTSIEELREAYHGPKIVATTCLGINHPIFKERIFDYCIVDEASQITLPVCLGPIRMARTFVLVGDHYQLPPLVQNEAAREGGLDISLFRLLSDKHPEAVVNLEHQYRMCQDIMMLSNTLIYHGLLKCGNDAVANRSLMIPNMAALKTHHYSSFTPSYRPPSQPHTTICLNASSQSCWLRHLLDPSVKTRFINTDPLLPGSREQAKGSRIVNPTEATLCTQLVAALLTTGVPASEIGVITVYRSQLALLKYNLRQQGSGSGGVEMHTTDKFQGRDKEIIILSLVRSNEARNIGDLLKDWRRINVAFTRARSKLLVLGSGSTLASNHLLNGFLAMMQAQDWVFDLPAGAPDMHVFEDTGTQMTVGEESVAGGGDQARALLSPSPSPSRKKRVGHVVEGRMSGKENISPKRRTAAGKGVVPERVLLGNNRSVLRDIVNELS